MHLKILISKMVKNYNRRSKYMFNTANDNHNY